MSYLITLAQVAARKPPAIYADPVDSHPREGSFVLVGNGRLYGGHLTFFKDARLDDGLLDCSFFKTKSHWDLLRYVQAIAFGTHVDLADVEVFPNQGTASDELREYVPVEVDGELTEPCRMSLVFHVAS